MLAIIYAQQLPAIVLFLLLAILASPASAQIDAVPVPTGVACIKSVEFNITGWMYEITGFPFDAGRHCCLDVVQPSISDAAQCKSYCEGNNWPWVYGHFRDNQYYSCICLQECFSELKTYFETIHSIYDTFQTPATTVTDLASQTSFTVDMTIQDDQYVPLILQPQQTARLQTSTSWDNANSTSFVAFPTIPQVTSGSVGFTIRQLRDYRVSYYDIQLRNNSFEVASNVWYYLPPIQTKRQVGLLWTYYLKNTGSDLQVVLSAGSELIASWVYSPIALNTDSSIISKIGNFVFNLDVQFNATVLDFCDESKTTPTCAQYELNVCENGKLTRKFCHLGCDYFARPVECLACNTSTCQGTCSTNSTMPQCVCSGLRIGAGCETDLPTSTFYLQAYAGDELAGRIIPFNMDIVNCSPGTTCATITYGVPPFDTGLYISPGSCCTANFTFTKLEQTMNTTMLRFERATEWTCFLSPNVEIGTDLLYETYDFFYPPFSRVSPYWSYPSPGRTIRFASEPSFVCDASINLTNMDDPRASVASAQIKTPVSASFAASSGTAVVVGFVVGFVVKPQRMLLKKKPSKKTCCLPKGEKALARSIIAIIVIDVAVVTALGILGLTYPITLLLLASGIMLVISSALVMQAGARFESTKLIKRLLIVQNVFGRVAGAFLIVISAGLFIFALSEMIPLLSLLAQVSFAVVGWLILATYCTWALVLVHFSTALQVCVSYYFSIMHKKKAHDAVELRVETKEQSSASSSDAKETPNQATNVDIINESSSSQPNEGSNSGSKTSGSDSNDQSDSQSQQASDSQNEKFDSESQSDGEPEESTAQSKSEEESRSSSASNEDDEKSSSKNSSNNEAE